MLLYLKYFNPQIQAELNIDSLGAKIYLINSIKLNFIDKLL